MGHQGDVGDVGLGGGVEGDRPLDAGIIEEIEVGAVDRLGGGLGVFHRGDAGVVRPEEGDFSRLVAHRQGAVAHPVVGGHRQQGGGPGGQPAGEVGLKGKKSPLVPGNQHPVQPDHGLVGHRTKPQHHPLAGAAPGQGHLPLVKHPAVVIPPGPVGVLVVEAGGHRRPLCPRQGGGRVGHRRPLCPRQGGGRVETGGSRVPLIQGKVPDAVQADGQTGGVLLGIQHGHSSSKCIMILWSGSGPTPTPRRPAAAPPPRSRRRARRQPPPKTPPER